MLSRCQADPVLSSVEDAVELCQKYISQNPQGALRGHNVHALESTETHLPVTEHLLEIRAETFQNSEGMVWGTGPTVWGTGPSSGPLPS